MMVQVRLCAVWPAENWAWLFHEPHAGFEDCQNMLLSCFRKRMSDKELKEYPGAFHNLLMELPDTRQATFEDINKWIVEKI